MKASDTVKLLLLLLVVFMVPGLVAGQTARAGKGVQTKAFVRAIDEFISAVYKRDGTRFDTLFFGKNADFPDMQLPAVIQHARILCVTAAEADKRRKQNSSLVFINMVGWVEKDKAEFMLVTFYPGYVHQFDCMIGLMHNGKSGELVLDKVQFKNYAYKGKEH